MATNLTALFYILLISTCSFLYLNKAIKPILNNNDLKIWFISWSALTTFAFLSTSLILFFAVSAAFIIYISRFVQNKFALYIILIFIVPSYIYKLPIITLNFQVLVGLVLLAPLFLSIFFKPSESDQFKKPVADYFFIGYLLLIFILQFRGVFVREGDGIKLTYISCIKDGINLFLQFYLPYFVASRYIKDFNQLKVVLIAFVTVCIFISPIAVFEVIQSNLLYLNLPNTLNVDWSLTSAVIRSNLVRATASIEHPLYLGTTMLIATFLYLFVAKYIKHKMLASLGFIIMVCGLLAPLSRGPWMGAILATICYGMMGEHKMRNFVLLILLVSLSVLILSLTNHLDTVVSFLPFIGDVDEGNIDYRAQLLEKSLLLIEHNPIFGTYNPEYHKSMQSLVQGEGIVDIVNLYLGVALNYGMVGLILYVGFFFTVTVSLMKAIFLITDKSSPEYYCGKSLLVILLGLYLVMTVIANSGFFNTLLFILVGISVSYVRITKGAYIKPMEQYPTSRVKTG
jgi:O-antigen ligase